ncbi:MAG TPA: lamin tail domain-containing protein, partial [Candidatus Binatia bacterium]|nr:lamin tail domain-containing protein [Candidatus Binatia bacterium]
VYKLILTENERVELAGIPCSGSQESDAAMNGTFITLDGVGTEVRYNCGFRNRGHGSRCPSVPAGVPNYRVSIPSDRRWKGQRALNVNSQNTPAQILGAVIAKKAGLPGADSRAVQVRVNNLNLAVSSGRMLGAYAVNEEINSDWGGEHFPFDSAGNIYRAIRDIGPPDWVYRGPSVEAYTNTYFKTDNNSAYDWSDLIQLHRIVGTNDLFTTANVRQVANVEQWCLFYAVMSLFGNHETSPNDGYNDDYFMYRGVNDPRFLLMYYDNDTILSSTFGARSSSDGIFSAEQNNGMGEMSTRFLEWPDFKPIYYATLQRLLNTTFSQPQFDALVDEVLSTYPPSTALDNVVASVKSYMATRRATVQGLINGLVPPPTNNPVAIVSGEPRSPTPFPTATLRVGGNGITHYQFRLNNGPYSVENPVATPIALNGLPSGSTNTVFVLGRNAAGIYQESTHPTVSRTWIVNPATPTVRLNEILARNDTALNHNGTFPDAVELFNEGTSPVDLSEMRLTDDPAAANKFTFPANTTLPAGSYLVLYANNNDGTPGFHLGFALNQDGDAVYLYDKVSAGGALLDSVVFGVQLPDKSLGRFNNGDWILCEPTLGSTNVGQPLGNSAAIKLNEWLTASGVLPFVDDFIELYNPDGFPVALGGMHLTDEPIGAPTLHRIADLSFIAGGGHLAFIADGDPSAGANHLNFRLDPALGEIGFNAPDGTPIDCVAYPPSRTGLSQGRCPDGATRIAFLVGP